MHRSARVSAIPALLLFSVVAAPVALAQDADSAPPAQHPLVGAWLVDTNTDDATDSPARVILGADGTLVQADANGAAVGAWEPTGERTGALTFTAEELGEDGELSTSTVRARLEAAEDGQSWTAMFTVEFIDPDGVSSGQLGPITANASRTSVEPVDPVASPGF